MIEKERNEAIERGIDLMALIKSRGGGMTAQERIEAAKGVDLITLIRSRGIKLKKNGKGYVGLCPFHAEAIPSFTVNPAKNFWQCFGCRTEGDAIRFVELFDKLNFPESVAALIAAPLSARPAATPGCADEVPAPLTVREQKLLARIVAYYQHTFTHDKRGLNYLRNEERIKGSGLNTVQTAFPLLN